MNITINFLKLQKDHLIRVIEMTLSFEDYLIMEDRNYSTLIYTGAVVLLVYLTVSLCGSGKLTRDMSIIKD